MAQRPAIILVLMFSNLHKDENKFSPIRNLRLTAVSRKPRPYVTVTTYIGRRNKELKSSLSLPYLNTARRKTWFLQH